MAEWNQFVGAFGGHCPGNDSGLKNRAFLGLDVLVLKLSYHRIGQADNALGMGCTARNGLLAHIDHGRVSLGIYV
jgi:hypothetical protein